VLPKWQYSYKQAAHLVTLYQYHPGVPALASIDWNRRGC